MFHIEVVNENGEIESRLYSRLVMEKYKSLIISIPICKLLRKPTILGVGTPILISFESVSKIAHRFKSTVIEVLDGKNATYLVIERPRKKNIFSYNERKRHRVKTYLEAFIYQLDQAQVSNGLHLDEFNFHHHHHIRTDSIVVDVSLDRTIGLLVPLTVAQKLDMTKPLIFGTDSKQTKEVFHRKTVVKDDSKMIGLYGTILDLRDHSDTHLKVIIKLHLTAEHEESLQLFVYETLENQLFKSFISKK